jgi:hypothetical protein
MSTSSVLTFGPLVNGHVKQQVVFNCDQGVVTYHRDWVDGVKGRGAAWTPGAAPADWDLPSSVTTHLNSREGDAVQAGILAPAVLRRLQVLRLDQDDNAEPEVVAAPVVLEVVPAPAPERTEAPAAPAVIHSYSEAEEAVLDNTGGKGLSALIPRELATPWVKRGDGIHGTDEFEVADGMRADGENLLLEGPTGTGKTHFVRSLAQRWEVPFLIFSGSASGDVETLIGYDQITSGDTKFVEGLLLLAITHPGGAAIVLDELNMFRQDILTPMFPLLDSAKSITVPGSGGVYSAVSGGFIAATMNPGYAGTMDDNEALRRRFQVVANWGYDEQVEKQMVEFDKYAVKYGLDFAIGNFSARLKREQERQIARDIFGTYRTNLAGDYNIVADQAVLPDSDFAGL